MYNFILLFLQFILIAALEEQGWDEEGGMSPMATRATSTNALINDPHISGLGGTRCCQINWAAPTV